jgi:hypothetical protein
MIPLSAAGILLRAIRYQLYALGVLVLFIVSEHLYLNGMAGEHGIPLASFISGGLIAGTGILLLARFIRRYRIEI